MPTKPRKTRSNINLEQIEAATARDIERRRRKTPSPKPDAVRRRNKKRTARTPRPPGATVEEIRKLPDDDPSLKDPRGRKKKVRTEHWKDAVRQDHADRVHKGRTRTRKRDAVVAAAAEQAGVAPGHRANGDVEMTLVASGDLDMDEWSVEELIRGYRKNRDGQFPKNPPKFIPREVQQEAFRRLLRHGSRQLSSAYINAITELIKIAQDPDVRPRERLMAITEIMNRVGGKVPERIAVSQESPWQDMLVDAVMPVVDGGNAMPIPMEKREDGTWQLSGGEEPSARGDERALPGGDSPSDAIEKSVKEKWSE